MMKEKVRMSRGSWVVMSGYLKLYMLMITLI
jgi:hypothetical protein